MPRYRIGKAVWGEIWEAFLEEARPEAALSSLASSQAVYQRLFEWVVNRINSVMETRDRDPRRDGKDTVIGVLDIYGFEVFPVNRCVGSHHSRSSVRQPLGRPRSRGAWLGQEAGCLVSVLAGP